MVLFGLLKQASLSIYIFSRISRKGQRQEFFIIGFSLYTVLYCTVQSLMYCTVHGMYAPKNGTKAVAVQCQHAFFLFEPSFELRMSF
jgi:hypothetical protein